MNFLSISTLRSRHIMSNQPKPTCTCILLVFNSVAAQIFLFQIMKKRNINVDLRLNDIMLTKQNRVEASVCSWFVCYYRWIDWHTWAKMSSSSLNNHTSPRVAPSTANGRRDSNATGSTVSYHQLNYSVKVGDGCCRQKDKQILHNLKSVTLSNVVSVNIYNLICRGFRKIYQTTTFIPMTTFTGVCWSVRILQPSDTELSLSL